MQTTNAGLDPVIQALLDCTDRYEAKSIPLLEEHLQKSIGAHVFNLEVSLALVKLYQFYPESVNANVLELVLVQALAHVEEQAFTLALYMCSDKIVFFFLKFPDTFSH